MEKTATSSLEIPSGTFSNVDGNAEDQMIPGKSASDLGAKKRSRRSEQTTGGTTRRRGKKRRAGATQKNVLIKYGALFLLVAQMVGLVLLMRVSRTNPTEGEPMYLASTAVFIMEVMKLGICCCVISYQSQETLGNEIQEHVLKAPEEMLKLSVPSFLYTVQNNLLYFALTNLDAATYQVCYQMKILTTAVFSMVMLQVSVLRSYSFFYSFHCYFTKIKTLYCTDLIVSCILTSFLVHNKFKNNLLLAKIFTKKMGSFNSFNGWSVGCTNFGNKRWFKNRY